MTTPTTPPLDTDEIRRRHGRCAETCILASEADTPCDATLLADALDAAREELAAARTVPPASEGTTHHAGCWRDRGHHACAIARVEELERECFHLAANQCKYPVAGEHGDALCGEIERLRANQLTPELVRERLGGVLQKIQQHYRKQIHFDADAWCAAENTIHAAARALLRLGPDDPSPLEPTE